MYFGHPACPECVEFEARLEEALSETRDTQPNVITYYVNTQYWKKSEPEKTKQVLENYRVETVPALLYTGDDGKAVSLEEFIKERKKETAEQSDQTEWTAQEIHDFIGPYAGQSHFYARDLELAVLLVMNAFVVCYLLASRVQVAPKTLWILLYEVGFAYLNVKIYLFEIMQNRAFDYQIPASLESKIWINLCHAAAISLLIVIRFIYVYQKQMDDRV